MLHHVWFIVRQHEDMHKKETDLLLSAQGLTQVAQGWARWQQVLAACLHGQSILSILLYDLFKADVSGTLFCSKRKWHVRHQPEKCCHVSRPRYCMHNINECMHNSAGALAPRQWSALHYVRAADGQHIRQAICISLPSDQRERGKKTCWR